MDDLKKQIDKFLGTVNNELRYIVDGKDMRARVLIEGKFVYPTEYEKTKIPIGYKFDNGKVSCTRCALTYDITEATAIYAINIIPYSQNCHICNCGIIIGWPCQLYIQP